MSVILMHPHGCATPWDCHVTQWDRRATPRDIGGSWSEVRAEPAPLHVLLLVLELREGQVWHCLLPTLMETETLAVATAGCLGLMNLGCSTSHIPDCFRKSLF